MILVHEDKEITYYNDKTKKYYTSRYKSIRGPISWDYKRLVSRGAQTEIGCDILGWWDEE